MELIFLHGPPAAGKLTVARALAETTGLALFHNHYVVDAVGAVFPFGSPAFRRLREHYWLEMFEAAAEAGRSLIFTFAPEGTVSRGFPQAAAAAVTARGGRVRFIALTCPDDEQERRLEAASRAEYGKLRSVDMLRDLKAKGAFDYPPLPAELTLNTADLAPADAAARIAEHLRS